ncbi:MAG TPA: chemotaxis protein CheW [Bacteroidales bacterium]
MNKRNAIRIERIFYLVFSLGNEKYALPVNKVISIQEMSKVTNVPLAPGFMKGIYNLRGKVLPIIDIKVKFGMGETTLTEKNCIVVLELDINTDKILIGALVDKVDSVEEIEDELIQPAPSIGNYYKSLFFSGIVQFDGEFVMLLDVKKLFDNEELEAIYKDQNVNETLKTI